MSNYHNMLIGIGVLVITRIVCGYHGGQEGRGETKRVARHLLLILAKGLGLRKERGCVKFGKHALLSGSKTELERACTSWGTL